MTTVHREGSVPRVPLLTSPLLYKPAPRSVATPGRRLRQCTTGAFCRPLRLPSALPTTFPLSPSQFQPPLTHKSRLAPLFQHRGTDKTNHVNQHLLAPHRYPFQQAEQLGALAGTAARMLEPCMGVG